jgi:hypothetical protein
MMKKVHFLGFPLLLIFMVPLFFPLQGCDPEDGPIPPDTTIVAYKPNIYLYPKTTISLQLKISFPKGGEIIASEPAYGTGWDVSVTPDGMINNLYPFLFYESSQPNAWQHSEGWWVEKADLETFFRSNLHDYGFRGNEITDFVEYWVPRLNSWPFYVIYPQTNKHIDPLIALSFSVQPNHLLRLFYLIEGSTDALLERPSPPAIATFNRSDFYVTEWGVLLK